jgi:hypothetical protein
MTVLVANPVATPAAGVMGAARKYLDKAMTTYTELGLKSDSADQPVQRLISTVARFGEDEALTISSVLARQSAFNEMARDQISGMEIAERYNGISTNFDSIRADAKNQLAICESGKVTIVDRVQTGWMNVSRGSIPKRFNKIKQLYNAVSAAMGDQIERETRILEAYADYRMAMKAAGGEALKLMANADVELTKVKKELEDAQNAVTNAPEGTPASTISDLELARDEKLREQFLVDEQYQVAKDLAEQMGVAYNASEFVFARLKQYSTVKKRLYDQTVVFFTTNEIVFTGIAAATNSSAGMVEGTRTINAMKDGINTAIEDLATLGGKALEDGLRAGYGSSIAASSIKKLIDETVKFQETSVQLIGELRVEATENATEVARLSEDGKRRFALALTKVASH